MLQGYNHLAHTYVLILYTVGSGVKEEVVLLPLVQDWALHLSEAGHGYSSNLTVLKVVLIQEARQEVAAEDVAVGLAFSYCELGLALEALAYQEEEEGGALGVVVEKESCLAMKLHLLLKGHFHDQTGKGRQVHKILAHHNLDIVF